MPLMLRQLIDEVEYFVGSTIDPRLDAARIANDAGQYLHSMHEWSWQIRPWVDLDFAADQSYVDLPVDFSKVVSIESKSTTRTFVLVTMSEIGYMRKSTSAGGNYYYAALSSPSANSRRDGPGPPRLELYPTPTSSSTGALTLEYRAGWIHLNEMIDVANVPPPFESLLLEIVRAHADHRVNKKSLAEVLKPIEESRVLNRLKASDGLSQADLGYSRGGQLQQSGETAGDWWTEGTLTIR